ncbi:SDR family oxidoreductase [Oscillatoriales cyanobacterium LEGE 11467]|uniref:SDR family oxidoreductase n=1 Tax=Zarconia navalis LEGE 11467 TaxID=1828826 RepID=A0A928ZBG6_9CYAN|nr:SDR family oxidoreductase [Zarconia navalis]MBE9042656.1 SDR family oxidoreductase [Zarconia navalis LEGE 11467]
MIDFTNKTTLITGGSSGMGLETARRIVQAGGNVVITGRTLSTLEEARSSLIQTDDRAVDRVMISQSDTSDLDSMAKTLEDTKERFGGLDNLFANAGIGIFKPLSNLTVEDFDKLISINLKGLFFTIQKAVPMMNDGGAILMTSSWTAHRGVAGAHLYSATKAALLSLTRTLALELAPLHIRINSISPGYINTPIVEKIGMSKEAFDAAAAQVPLDRWGESDEVGTAAAFLLSEAARYISGQDLIVDGGLVGTHNYQGAEV